jgi:hypothetical protein
VSLSTLPVAWDTAIPPNELRARYFRKIRWFPLALTGVIRVSMVSMLSGSLSWVLIKASRPSWLPSHGLKQWNPFRFSSAFSASEGSESLVTYTEQATITATAAITITRQPIAAFWVGFLTTGILFRVGGLWAAGLRVEVSDVAELSDGR